MLRTSIAAVVLGCFHLCPLDCDASVMVVECAAIETGCMLEKYKKAIFSVSAITNAVSVAPILLLWLLLRKDMHFFFWWSCCGCYSLVLLAALPLLLVFVLLTSSLLKQRELPASVSSFHVSVLYTAMLRTSIFCCCSWLLLYTSFRLLCSGYGC